LENYIFLCLRFEEMLEGMTQCKVHRSFTHAQQAFMRLEMFMNGGQSQGEKKHRQTIPIFSADSSTPLR